MKPNLGVFVTINTDAGFSYKHRIGTFAYWIKGLGYLLNGSGVFKEPCIDPTDAEIKAIINALAVIKKTKHPPILGFVINRDNIYANSRRKGTTLERKLHKEIKYFKKDAEDRIGLVTFMRITRKQKKYADFRHVKAHSGKNDKRSWVNEYCDRQCKLRFSEWFEKNITNKQTTKQ